MNGNIKDLSGQKFNLLSVISENGRSKDGKVLWKCNCDCGNIASIRGSYLKSGHTKSCGCLLIKQITEVGLNNITHGLSATSEYQIYQSMIQRCTNINNHAYKDYGGRGITICNRWLESFENFYADIGPRPTPDHSLDRKENDGNYEPNNCRWVTMEEQGNNRRSNHIVTYNGKDYTIAELAKSYGLDDSIVRDRIRIGWSTEKIIETTVRPYTRT